MKNRSSFAIVFIHSTQNNTIVSVTDLKSKLLFCYSCGLLGFKGSKRGTSFGSQNLGFFIGKKLIMFGYKLIIVKVKGFGIGRHSSLKGLTLSGIKLLCLIDVTKVAFNGCKLSKKRRI